MSEEETNLRDLVSQTLDARGVLPKIRAELRANVFLALEETQDFKDNLLFNKELRDFAKTADGPVILNLVREFLDFFNLDFTLAVLNPESRCSIDYNEMSRADLLKKLPFGENVSQKLPLICQLIDLTRVTTSLIQKNKFDTNLSSPLGLNSTYTKEDVSLDNTPVQVEETPAIPEVDETSTISTESISEVSAKHGTENKSSDHSNSGNITPTNEKQDESFNLLVFTPVQQVRTVPKVYESKEKTEEATRHNVQTDKSDPASEKSAQISSNGGVKIDETGNNQFMGKKAEKGMPSLLSDLPPLTPTLPPLNKNSQMSEIRKLLEQGLSEYRDESLNSLGSKSDRNSKAGSQPDTAPDSDGTIPEDDEINDLLHSHTSSDEQQTMDETISKLSNLTDLDHLENV